MHAKLSRSLEVNDLRGSNGHQCLIQYQRVCWKLSAPQLIKMKQVAVAVHRSLPQIPASVLAIDSDNIPADCVPQVCLGWFLALQTVLLLQQVRRAFLEPMARCKIAFSHPMPRLIN